VPADRPGRAPALARGDLLADGVAARVAPGAIVLQGDPRLEDRLTGGAGRGAHDLGDLGVAHAADLAQQERVARAVQQLADRVQHGADLLADRDRLGRPVRVVGDRGDELARGAATAHERDRLVVRDPVEPRAHGDDVVARAQPVVGSDEGVLDGVVGVLDVAEDRGAVREQPGLQPSDERREGEVVPSARTSGKDVVTGEPVHQRCAHRSDHRRGG
jgi:hypothetical protein